MFALKKTVGIALTFLLLFALSACGQTARPNTSADNASDNISKSADESKSSSASPDHSSADVAQEMIDSMSEGTEIQPDYEAEVKFGSAQSNLAPDTDGLISVNITVGSDVFAAKFYDTESARVLVDRMPMTLQMEDHAGQEKVSDLSYDFPTVATQTPSTIRTGELYLWSGSSLVLFYTTFPNSYSYVPIGYIEDTSGLGAALGTGSASVTFHIP